MKEKVIQKVIQTDSGWVRSRQTLMQFDIHGKLLMKCPDCSGEWNGILLKVCEDCNAAYEWSSTCHCKTPTNQNKA